METWSVALMSEPHIAYNYILKISEQADDCFFKQHENITLWVHHFIAPI